MKQECIPVGCVPAARRPYAGVCFPGGGVPGPGGVVVVSGLGGGVWSGGVVSAPGGWVSQHVLRQTPLPPVDRQTPVKILPWPNFVAAGNDYLK